MTSTWPEPVDRVATFLRESAAEARLEEFSSGAATAAAAAETIGCELRQIVKSLVFICDEHPVVVLVPGDRRVDERAVAVALGATEVRVARADEVLEATGFEPGGVAPFPQKAISRTLMDSSFLQHQVVWIGAGTASHMAALAPAELLRLSGATAFDPESAG